MDIVFNLTKMGYNGEQAQMSAMGSINWKIRFILIKFRNREVMK
jgi:hypothetical protein